MSNRAVLEEELKAQLIKLLHVFMVTKTSYAYAEYFHNPSTLEERKVMADGVYSSHFAFINHVLFKSLIIEMSKLFSNKANDKFRITKFINGLKKEGHFYALAFDQNLLAGWESTLLANKKTIDLIIKVRDELYSHTDGKEEDYNQLGIYFQDLEKLINLVEDILRNYFSFFFGASVDFTLPEFDRQRFPILKVLAAGEDKRKQDIMNEAIRDMNSYKKY